jgi:hypothetical protein
MFLKTKDGIWCDLCGKEYRRKFVYYSAEFTKIMADAEKKQTGPCDVDRKYLNLDICVECYEKIAQEVLKISKSKES